MAVFTGAKCAARNDGHPMILDQLCTVGQGVEVNVIDAKRSLNLESSMNYPGPAQW